MLLEHSYSELGSKLSTPWIASLSHSLNEFQCVESVPFNFKLVSTWPQVTDLGKETNKVPESPPFLLLNTVYLNKRVLYTSLNAVT